MIYYKQDDIYFTFNVLKSINDGKYTEEVTQNGQARETGNTGHTRQRKKQKQKQVKPNTMCVGHYYPQANTNNVNKT
jgi:hypothetical protein